MSIFNHQPNERNSLPWRPNLIVGFGTYGATAITLAMCDVETGILTTITSGLAGILGTLVNGDKHEPQTPSQSGSVHDAGPRHDLDAGRPDSREGGVELRRDSGGRCPRAAWQAGAALFGRQAASAHSKHSWPTSSFAKWRHLA